MNTKWNWQPLGDVCKTSSGATPLKSKKEYYEGGNIPWLLSGEVAQGEITESKKFITQKGLENSAAKLFPENSVLVAMYGATAGQVGILRFEASTNQAICAILPNDNLLPKFLFYSFLHKKDDLVATASGNAQPNISQIKIKQTKIPIIAVEEQRRVVAVLDKAFAAIATATANAEKNLANARALFESYLESQFEDIFGSWKTSKFSDVCDKITDGTHHSPKKIDPEPSPGKYLYITSKNIRNDGMDLTKIGYIDSKLHNEIFARCDPEPGDILLTKDGANTGNVCLNSLQEPFSLLSSVCLIKPNRAVLHPKFLLYFLQSAPGQKQITGQMTGAAIKRIILKTIRNATIPLPSLEKQIGIVERLDAVLDQKRLLESNTISKLAALSELKQSLLQKSFSGELT